MQARVGARFGKALQQPKVVVTIALVFVALVAIVSTARGQSPLVTTPLVPARLCSSGDLLVVLSLGLGVALAAANVALTRALAARSSRVRELGLSLRPRVAHASSTALVLTAIVVGVAEEVLFRGVLVPFVGIVASSIAFGLVHQVRGRARFVYVAWATALGLALASIFRLTGSLMGPILAHVSINAVNALYLRDHAGEPSKPRELGGLLSRR